MATPRHAIVLFINYLSFITVAHCQGYGYPAQNNPYQMPSPTAKSEKSRYFHSDQRCIEDITTYNREEVVYVTLSKYGKVAGRVSFLCDLPGVSERDRPQANYANSAYSSANLYPYQSRPIHRARIHTNVSVFLGIPYARPPTKENNRRFRDTISPDHWGSIDAFDFGPSCPQPSEFTGQREKIEKVDEDCLYMNIYSPHVSAHLKCQKSVTPNIWFHFIDWESTSNKIPCYDLHPRWKLWTWIRQCFSRAHVGSFSRSRCCYFQLPIRTIRWVLTS